MKPRKLFGFILLSLLAIVLAACAGPAGEQGLPGPAGPPGPEGPQGPPGEAATADELACTACHNETDIITGKVVAWEDSNHGMNESFARGTSPSCAGCHSGSAFSEMVAAGLHPGSVESGDPDPTRQDCRACHQIHESFTAEDWALETTDPVELYAFEGSTYDGGKGNLCAVCHQARRGIDEAVDGQIEITSTHWGPHHGPQSAMLLGLAGAGAEGSPSAHYQMIEDTCVSCHLSDHSFEASLDSCQECHSGAESFDINGLQTEVQAQLDELEEALIAQGLLDEEGHPAVETVPAEEAEALWNWIYIAHEDKSLGVHNPAYTTALLEASLEALGLGE